MAEATVDVVEASPVTYKVGERRFTLLFPDLMRPLTPYEDQEMRRTIADKGVVVPVVVDEDDGVIEGGNRVRIASELGIEKIPTETREGLTLEQKRVLAEELNHCRRHLSPKDWRDMQKKRAERIARAVELRKARKPYRVIAAELGVSEKQIREDIKKALADAEGSAPPAPIEAPGIVEALTALTQVISNAPSANEDARGNHDDDAPEPAERSPSSDFMDVVAWVINEAGDVKCTRRNGPDQIEVILNNGDRYEIRKVA